MRRPEYRPLADWPRQLSDALGRLEQLSPMAKKTLIDGLVKTIASDEVMGVSFVDQGWCFSCRPE